MTLPYLLLMTLQRHLDKVQILGLVGFCGLAPCSWHYPVTPTQPPPSPQPFIIQPYKFHAVHNAWRSLLPGPFAEVFLYLGDSVPFFTQSYLTLLVLHLSCSF